MGLTSSLCKRLLSSPSVGGRISNPSSARRFRPRLEALEDRLVSAFALSGSYMVGEGAQAVAMADLNGDGRLDLVTANAGTQDPWGSPSVSVLLAKNNGKTGFQPAQDYPLYGIADATSLLVADVNGDDNLDVVTAYNAGGAVLLGRGDGTFQYPRNFSPAGDLVGVGEFNGDGKLDLVTTAGLLLGNGDGTFGDSWGGGLYTTPGQPMAVGDFTNDGQLDLIVRGYDSASNSVTVNLLPGNGDGTFGTARTIASFANGLGYSEIKAVTAADFNADGLLDLAVSYSHYENTGSTLASVMVDTFLGRGDGTFTFQGTSQFGVDFWPEGVYFREMQVAAGDVNQDGKLDLVTVGLRDSTYQAAVLLGKGDGTFAASPVRTPCTVSFALGDLNGDRYPDLAGVSGRLITVFLNDKHWGTKSRGK